MKKIVYFLCISILVILALVLIGQQFVYDPAINANNPFYRIPGSPLLRLSEDKLNLPPVPQPIPREYIGPIIDPSATESYDMNTKQVIKIPSSDTSQLPPRISVAPSSPFPGIIHPEIIQESVIPPDDRVLVSPTTSYPWRTICKIFITFPDTMQFTGTAAIIDDFHILTAGHCVYNADHGGWAVSIETLPGLDGIILPFGHAWVTNARAYTGWTDLQLPEHDWAVCTLDRNVGFYVGYMGRDTTTDLGFYLNGFNTAGYPGDLSMGYFMYELDPTFAMAYLRLALAHLTLANTKESIEAVEKAKAYSTKLSNKEKVYLELAYDRIVERDDEKYFKILQDAARKYPKEKDFHYRLGWHYQARVRDLEKAIDEYNKTLELDPYHISALNQLGWTYATLMDYEKSIEYFKRAISSNPDSPNPIDSLGEIYFEMGRLDEAIAKLKEALEIRPDFIYSSHNIIYIYAAKEDYSEVIKWTDRFIDIAPSSMIKLGGFTWKGFYNFWLGSFENSLRDLDKAYELAEEAENEPAKASVQVMKSWVYEDKGELDLSRKYYENSMELAIASGPQNEQWDVAADSFSLGILDVKSKNIDSAKKRIEKMRSVFPELSAREKEWVTLWIDLLQAEIFLAEGKIEQAIAAFENTPHLRPPGLQYQGWILTYNYPSLKDILARAYQQKGDIDSAIVEYERLTTFDPQSGEIYLIHPKYYYRLAKLYEQKGWTGKAIEHYEKFLTLWKDADPGLAEVEDARKRLAGLRE